MNNQKVVIIGGGISGLSFAHYLADSEYDVLVLEGDHRVGGCLHTHRTQDGYWFELGGHSTYNSYGNFIEIIERNNMLENLLPREKASYKLYKDEKICSILQEINLLELLGRVPKMLFLKREGMTIREYFSGIVGEGNYKRVIGPFLAAVPSQRADDFPADMLFKKRPRRKDIVKKFTMKGGLMSVLEAIAAHPKITVQLNAKVASIKSNSFGFDIVTEEGRLIEAEQLVLAISPSQAALLLAEVYPDISSELGRIKTVKIDTVGVIAKVKQVHLQQFAGLVPLNDIFFSIVTRDYLKDKNHRGFAFHFQYGLAEDVRNKRISEVLKVPLSELELTQTVCREISSPVMGHHQLVAGVQTLLVDKPLYLTGNYFSGLAIEDCVERSRQEFDRLLENSA